MKLQASSRCRVGQTSVTALRAGACRHSRLSSSHHLRCPLPGAAVRRSSSSLLPLCLRLRSPLPSTSSISTPSSALRLPRDRLVTAATSRGSSSSSSNDSSSYEPAPSLESLTALKLPDLKDRCRALGLSPTGNKATLAQRIWDAQQQQQQQQGEAPAADPAAAAAAGGGGDDGDVTREELVQELIVEISSYGQQQLLACLADRGLSQEGSKAQLMRRLAEAIADETQLDMDFDEPAAAAPAAQQQQQGTDAAAAAGGVGAPSPPPPPEREWLIADKQQVLLDELLAMGVLRQELVDILADMGQDTADDETLEELAERASWLLAEEEVLLSEQQAAGGGGAEGGADPTPGQQALADHPSSILDGLTATDVNKLKVDDLRKYLVALGLSDEGSRYVLRDRLVTMLVVRKAATAGDMDVLLKQLTSMTMSELRGELERRRLELSGTKAALELRLAQAMVVEIAGPHAASILGEAAGADKETESAYEPDPPLAEDYDEFLTAAPDPAFRVALLCGTAAAAAAADTPAPSSSSRLYRVSQALSTAVTLIDELHTAPLDPKQAAAMEASSAAVTAAPATDAGADSGSSSSSSSSSSKGKRGRTKKTDSAEPTAAAAESEAAAAAAAAADPSKVPARGITVDVYWGDDASCAFYELPRTALAAIAPADMAAVLPALATAKFESATALAQHLKASGAGAALSMLPGGPLACGGALSAACAAAGVPLAVQDSSSSSSSTGAAAAVLGRAAVLRELQQRGYITLPVFEVTREQLAAAQGEVAAWLQACLAAVAGEEEQQQEEEEGGAAAADPDDAFAEDPTAAAAAADGGEDTSSSTVTRHLPVSPLLKAWSAARYAPAADPAAAAAATAGEGGEAAAAVAAVPPLPALVAGFVSWCEGAGLDPDTQLLTVSGGGGGGALSVVRGGAALLQDMLDRTAAAADTQGAQSCPSLLLVEPLHRQLCRWEVVVTVSPDDGPVALLPVEVETGDTRQELREADLALQEWRMMQAGLEPDEITAQLEALSADEPGCVDALTLPDSPDPLPYHTTRLHSPPRVSAKLVHTMRHAAAKAVGDLGLAPAGLVRVRGWYAAAPDWQERYALHPAELHRMPDADPRQLQRVRDDQLSRRSTEPLPLADYYDEVLLLPDLDRFDPGPRCSAESNGEGDVLLADVSVDVPLHTTSLAGLTAAEVGLGPGGLARHLINLALFAAGQDPLLPPPHPPALEASAQWAQLTGANDTLSEIAAQLADTNEKVREALETGHHRVAEAERSAAFSQLDSEAAVTSILDGLSFAGGTMEALTAPPQEPEEWTPEFDSRPQAQVSAERDAQRTAEDLAARQMRDEALPMFGDQPIRYDRYDPMLDWEPPFAAAAAAGRPIPSVDQLRQEAEARVTARDQELLADPDQDPLAPASGDEVMMNRLLEGSFYEDGVKATIKRRAQQASETAGGGGAATLAAAAMTANVEAAEVAGEAAALAADAADAAAAAAAGDAGDGSSSSSSAGVLALLGSGDAGGSLREAADRWPWPTVDEVLDEAAVRRAAQRVWVLMGGDGPGRQQALRSGANIWAKLQRCCDLQVDAFLLPPPGAGLDEAQRRSALLARRTEWRALGIPESEYPDSMRDDQLLSMPPSQVPTLQRPIIVAGPAQLGRHTVEEATEAAERLGQLAGADYYGARVVQQQQIQAVRDTQMELDAHFVMQLLEGAGVPFTGVTADYALTCCNRIALNKHITEFADSISEAADNAADTADADADADADAESGVGGVGLVPMPIKVIKTDSLLGCQRTPQAFDDLFAELMSGWEACDSLVLRPPADSAGLGLARIHTPADLAAYAAAIEDAVPRLPPDSLSQQQGPVTLPLDPPALLVVEPWVGTAPVRVVAAGAEPGCGLEVTWEGDSSDSSSGSSSSRWLEVSIGLVGELGSMSALPPTLICRTAEGSRHLVTPPPAHILPPASIGAAQGCAVALALGLGLRSIASVDGFVHADTGELIVRDVKPSPPLTDGSPLLQQVMVLDPPVLPHQLFRALARDAWLTTQAARAAAAAGAGSSISSAYYNSAAADGGLGAADFELAGVGNVGVDEGDDLFGGPGGPASDAGDAAGGLEDEDMQAAGYTA